MQRASVPSFLLSTATAALVAGPGRRRNTGKERRCPGQRRSLTRSLAATIFRLTAMSPELTSGLLFNARSVTPTRPCFEPRATVYRLICR